MSPERPIRSTVLLGLVAVISTLVVHALPLALSASSDSFGLVSVALLASFLVLHPAMTLPLVAVLRHDRRRGLPRAAVVRRGAATGFVSGTLLLLSHTIADRLLLGVEAPTEDAIASLVHVALGTLYGLGAGALASRTRTSA